MWSVISLCMLMSVHVLSNESGKNSKSISDRIIGGHSTTIQLYPHQVAIFYGDDRFCGGFIVSEKYILSAASCIPEDFDLSTVLVRAGSGFIDNGTEIPITDVTPHPDYNNYDKDIACLGATDPIQFTDSIQPIKLPPKNRVIGGDVTVTGWGITERNSSTLTMGLREVELPVVNSLECSLFYGENLTRNMWCAGDLFGHVAACKGDTGGAAVQDDMAVGIVSFSDCSGQFSPTIFTDIAAPDIRDFITNNLRV